MTIAKSLTVLLVLYMMMLVVLGCSGEKTLLYWHNGKIFKEYTSGKGSVLLAAKGEYPAWIPGKKTHFAYVERKPGMVPMKLWVAKKDGMNPVALTKFEVHHGFSWSPDGKWIAVAHTKDGNYEIYKIKPDGSALIRLTKNVVTDQYPAWSPKGDKIAFFSSRLGSEGIYIIDSDGKNEKLVTPSSLNVLHNLHARPSWSGDGKQIAFVGRWGAKENIGIVDVQTGKVTQLTKQDGAHDPLWYGEFIFYFLFNDLYRHDTSSGKTKNLGRFIPEIPHSALSANATHVFFSFGGKGAKEPHIYSVKHNTAEKVDIGAGEWPNVW